jgi:hypothetical protein
MNNLYKVFSGLTLSTIIVASSFSFTACSDDDLDTNPYNRSGVSLVAMGPMPVSRLDQIRITGTQLKKVNEIIFPAETGVGELSVSDFSCASDEEITVTVPDAAIPGHIKLVAGADTITSLSLITYVEPIDITEVSPLDDLNAGDIITIDGEFVYNIATATFTDGVVVEAPDFVYTSRKQVKIAVPKEAVSGQLVLSDGDENDPQEFTFDIQINSASITALDKNADAGQVYEFGDEMILTGTHFDLVETVSFSNYESVDFEVNEDGTQLKTHVPEFAISGSVTLNLYSGVHVSSPQFLVPLAEVTSIAPVEELNVGDVVTITGKNLDRVQSLALSGNITLNKGQFTQSESQITFNVPEDMGDGVVTLYQHVYYSVETDKIKMHHEGAEDVIWSGSFDNTGWGGNQDLAWGGFDWSTVKAGQVLTIYGHMTDTSAYGGWGCISLRHGTNWGNLPDNAGGQLDWGPDDTSCSLTLTQEIIDDIIDNGGLVITGDNITVTSVTLSVLEQVIWSGSFDNTGWGGNQDLAWGGFDWSTVSAGKTLVVTGHMTDTSAYGGWGCISLRHGTNWGNLPDNAGGQLDWGPDDTSCSLTLTQEILTDIIDNGGLVITGDNITVTQVSLK